VAARVGNVEIARLMLDRGASVDAASSTVCQPRVKSWFGRAPTSFRTFNADGFPFVFRLEAFSVLAGEQPSGLKWYGQIWEPGRVALMALRNTAVAGHSRSHYSFF
jgi:hypothetical protein